MRKIVFVLTFLLLLTATLSGCADVDGGYTFSSTDISNSQDLSNDDKSSLPDDKSSNVSPDSVIDIPSECKIYKQKLKTFSEDQLLSFFSETPEKTYDTGGDNTVCVCVLGSQRGTTDGTSLAYTTDAGMICALSYDTIGTLYNEQSDIVSLEFADFDNVLEAVEEQMSKLGFPLDEWFVNKVYTVKAADLDKYKQAQYNAVIENPYSLDESELQKEIEQADRVNKYPSKDSYVIDIKFKLSDVKIYTGNTFHYGEYGYRVFGVNCQMIYSKDGLERISIFNVYETESYEDAEIISPTKARELLDKKYNEIIFNGDFNINSTELIYMPIPQENLGDYANRFETRPFYAVHYILTEYDNGEAVSSNVTTYFDAVTGTELTTERVETDMIVD